MKIGLIKIMANSIPRDFIDRLIDDSDIVAVISNYVSLTKKGNNFTCCCPFHDEKTPSFSVSPQKSIYHCFGCGNGGNVLSFIMDFEGLNFVEAVERLADMNNISVPREASSGRNDFSKIYELNELVANAYFSALKKDLFKSAHV